MHWCDSIKFELVGTDAYCARHDEDPPALTLRDLRLQGDECEFCASLAGLIDYRLRNDTTWRKEYYALTFETPTPPTEEEMSEARVNVVLKQSMEARNWSFGFEGITYRSVLEVNISIDRRFVRILLQRAGPGGRVPVTHKSATPYGPTTITYTSPGSWDRTNPAEKRYGVGPDQREKVVASLQTTLGRPRPLLIEFDRIRKWIQNCDSGHSICQREGNAFSIPRFRLIDTKNMCIIEISGLTRPPFATLSYVWGKKPFLRLTSDNIASLKIPGCLSTATLPLTIRDAITVCEKLQIEHLWVDSLCILQDDESDMIETIDKMDSIYTESILTIVAASGSDAHCGIPGVHPGTRYIEQRLLEKRGVPLIDSVDYKQLRDQTQFQEPEWISATPWAQRTWTFQEALVSRRVLFFTSEQVYWSCREGLLSEDTTDYITSGNEPRLDTNFDPLEYKQITLTFSTRRLTFEDDMGRAYLGTQNYLDKKWGGQKFSWGLPHGAFGSFLMWEWPFTTSRQMRNGVHPVKQFDGSVVKVPFPTWSWMGWTEGDRLHGFFGDEPGAHSPMFFVFDLGTTLMKVQDGVHWRSQPNPLAHLLAARPESTQTEVTDVTYDDLPAELHSTPSIKHAALAFYTETVRVRYDPSAGFSATSSWDTPSDLKMTRQAYPFPIMIGDKFYPILEENQIDTRDKEGLEEIELVAVFAGQMTKPRKFRGEYRLYCWSVVRKGNMRIRASYMATVIFLKLWNILPKRQWELVVMI